MKYTKLLILLLVVTVSVQASPRGKHRPPHGRYSGHVHFKYYSYHPYRYNHYTGYGYYHYYRPTVVTTKSTTTYPTNLEIITAESVSEDIVILSRLMSRGLISEKDYDRAKKTLLNRIGMAFNPEALAFTTAEICAEIETVYQMRTADLISEREFKKQKDKLLSRI